MGNLFKSTPRKLRKFLVECIQAGVVPNIIGSPGIGKSTIVDGVSQDYRLWLIDHRLSTSEPTDMTGLPKFRLDGTRERAFFAPFDIFPLEGDPLPKNEEGKELEGWLLFLDEANAAPRSVQAAAYKLVLDKKVGQHKLHPNVAIVLAGNLMTDRSIVNALSTAMQSRLVHIEVEVSFQEWLQDVAIPQHYDARIIAFLSQWNDKLMDFRPDHQEATFCCPRTWEFTNKLLTGKEFNDKGEFVKTYQKPMDEDMAVLLTGTITSGVAMEFKEFCKVYTSMISVSEICKDPKNCPLPGNKSLQWAVLTHMMDKITEQNFDDLATYADRWELPFRILFYRSIIIRQKSLLTHKQWGPHQRELAKYLTATPDAPYGAGTGAKP